MGLVAGEIGFRLIELRLKGARVELGQELALFDGLAVLEIDADDRFRDHAADRRRVQRRNIADPGQHDREILLFDGGRDDGNGGWQLRRPSAGTMTKMLPPQVTPGENRDHYDADN